MQVVSQLEQERKAHGLLLKKYALLEAEKGELVKLTEELRGRLAPPQQHCPTPLTHPLPQNESALPPPASPHPLPSLTYHTPLKEAPPNIGSVFPFHLAQHIKQEDWKIVRQKLSSGPEDKRESQEPREGSRGNSLKRQPSNHEISRKPSMALL